MLVHELSRVGIFERLMRHDVTPVTGGVADAQEDRFLRGFGERERFLAPGIPIHRVVLMLLEVWAGGVRKSVGHVIGLSKSVGYVGDRRSPILAAIRRCMSYRVDRQIQSARQGMTALQPGGNGNVCPGLLCMLRGRTADDGSSVTPGTANYGEG